MPDIKKSFLLICSLILLILSGCSLTSPISKEEEVQTQGIEEVLAETERMDIDDDTVAFYGRDLENDEMVRQYLSEIPCWDLVPEISVEPRSETVRTEVYAMVITTVQDMTSLAYYSYEYPVDAEDDMRYYFQDVLTETSVRQLAEEYVENGLHMMRDGEDGNGWVSVLDHSSRFDYYTPSGTAEEYLMKMYEKKVLYRIGFGRDLDQDSDYYSAQAVVEIVPGNALEISEQRYPEYQNAIVVCGAETSFETIHVKNRLASGAPTHFTPIELTKGSQYGPNLTWTGENSADGTTIFKDDIFRNQYTGTDSAVSYSISANPFSYRMYAEVIAAPEAGMSLQADTKVCAMFQNEAISEAEWSGTSRRLVYQAAE